jgi:hypothetical protein
MAQLAFQRARTEQNKRQRAEPGPVQPPSPARVAETLANGLAADPLFCDLLANLHLPPRA